MHVYSLNMVCNFLYFTENKYSLNDKSGNFTSKDGRCQGCLRTANFDPLDPYGFARFVTFSLILSFPEMTLQTFLCLIF